MCFTRTRSPVRTRQETKLFFSCPDIIFAPWQARYDICKIWYLDTKNKIDTVHTVTQTFMIFAYFEYLGYKSRFYGVMVSTLDFESSDPSSNLGGTYPPFSVSNQEMGNVKHSQWHLCQWTIIAGQWDPMKCNIECCHWWGSQYNLKKLAVVHVLAPDGSAKILICASLEHQQDCLWYSCYAHRPDER